MIIFLDRRTRLFAALILDRSCWIYAGHLSYQIILRTSVFGRGRMRAFAFNGATQSYVVAQGVAVCSGSVLGIWVRGIGGFNEHLACLSDWFPIVMRG